jgi:hypothetical protein
MERSFPAIIPRAESRAYPAIGEVSDEKAGRLHGKPTGMARGFDLSLPARAGLTGVVVVLKFTLTFASVWAGASA